MLSAQVLYRLPTVRLNTDDAKAGQVPWLELIWRLLFRLSEGG